MSRLPDFLIVGAPKAGTTSMHQYLQAHPRVYMPDKKELHFFSYPYLKQNCAGPGDREVLGRLCGTLEEYAGWFKGARADQVVGEASPSYLYFNECIPEIIRVLGSGVRVIIMLRNPVQRALSNYLHQVNAGKETLGFREALEAEGKRKAAGWGDFWRYREHSLYADKVKAYLEAFPRRNIKFILFEEMTATVADTVRDVYRFLDLDDGFIPPEVEIIYGRGGRPKSRAVERLLTGAGRAATTLKGVIPKPVYQRLRRVRHGLEARNREPARVKVGEDVQEWLENYFKDDIRETEVLTGLDLSIWRSRAQTKLQTAETGNATDD